MKHPSLFKFGLAVGVLVVVLVLGALNWRPSTESVEHTSGNATTTTITAKGLTLTTTEGQEHWYTNKELKFSFRLPDGFMAPEGKTDSPNTHAVVVHDDADNKILVIVLPIESGTKLIKEDIAANLPDVPVSNIREGFVGTVIRGFSFSSDAEYWGGASVNFWFAYNGYLYQISTSDGDVALLEFVMNSWRFDPPTPPPLR
jgi:hypothetical protein